jgi:hypothetical protein
VNAHPGTNAFTAGALVHGFSIAFYVLAAIAAVGSLLSALVLEAKPAEAEVELVPDAEPEWEAAA